MPDIATADWSWINAAAERFERAAKEGRRPRIEDYLANVAQARREALLDELMRVELELRRRAGEQPVAAEYHIRFREYAAVVEAVFQDDSDPAGKAEPGEPRPRNGTSARRSGQKGDPRLFQSTAPGDTSSVESV